MSFAEYKLPEHPMENIGENIVNKFIPFDGTGTEDNNKQQIIGEKSIAKRNAIFSFLPKRKR